MEPSPDPVNTARKRRSTPLQDAARECWALACWLTLRRTWADWEKTRAGGDLSPRSQAALPPAVEKFFGSYAHTTYSRWIPAVSMETLTRKERDRKNRKAAREDAAQFDRLVNADADAEDPKLETTALQAREEVAGVLAEELGWNGDGEGSGDDESEQQGRRAGSSQDPKLAFHTIHIEIPERPRDGQDRTPWEAWVRTLGVLWEPTKRSRRVLMNELFKQPLSKPSATPTDMLRCLTGYLKVIVREAVREAARQAVRVASDESFTPLDAPASRSDPKESFTGLDVIPDAEDITEKVAWQELEAVGAKFAEAEFNGPDITDGVRLAWFLESLKSDDGDDKGLTVGVYHTAILATLRTSRSTLGDRIQECRRRLANAVHDQREHLSFDTRMVILASARVSMHQLATDWFWSEKCDATLFHVVMDIIHTEDDPKFGCPRAGTCQQSPAATTDAPACWTCPRKIRGNKP